MAERRNHPFSSTIYFYAARGRLVRVLAVRQPSGRKTLFTTRDFFFGGSFSWWCTGGRPCRARSEVENKPVRWPRGWGIFAEGGSGMDLTGGLFIGSGKISRCLAAATSPFSRIFPISSVTQPGLILPLAPGCAVTAGARVGTCCFRLSWLGAAR